MTKKTQNQTQQVVVNENNCDVEQTRSALSDLYKNTTMSQDAIKKLIAYVDDSEVNQALHNQVEQYDRYTEQIGTLADKLNFDPTPAPKIALVMASLGLKSKLIANKSLTHIAKIMMQGTLNGIIDMYRTTKQDGLHPEVALLAKQILHYEESRLEQLKSWL